MDMEYIDILKEAIKTYSLTQDSLLDVFIYIYASFIDWKTGTCSFDSLNLLIY